MSGSLPAVWGFFVQATLIQLGKGQHLTAQHWALESCIASGTAQCTSLLLCRAAPGVDSGVQPVLTGQHTSSSPSALPLGFLGVPSATHPCHWHFKPQHTLPFPSPAEEHGAAPIASRRAGERLCTAFTSPTSPPGRMHSQQPWAGPGREHTSSLKYQRKHRTKWYLTCRNYLLTCSSPHPAPRKKCGWLTDFNNATEMS